MMVTAYRLPNGRVVQLRQLSATEKDDLSLAAAALVGKDATAQMYAIQETRDLVRATIYKVTKLSTYADVQSSFAAGVDWEKCNADSLDEGPYAYDKLFGVIEDELISAIYRKMHTVTKADLDDVMGKGLPVSAD